jgi:hypothetical protein
LVLSVRSAPSGATALARSGAVPAVLSAAVPAVVLAVVSAAVLAAVPAVPSVVPALPDAPSGATLGAGGVPGAGRVATPSVAAAAPSEPVRGPEAAGDRTSAVARTADGADLAGADC